MAQFKRKQPTLLVLAMIGCLVSAPALAQDRYSLGNPQGGDEGVSTAPSGAYNTPYTICGQTLYVNDYSVDRVNSYFLPAGQLIRWQNGQAVQILCRWGSW